MYEYTKCNKSNLALGTSTNKSILVLVEYIAKSTSYSLTIKTDAVGAVCGAGDSYEPPLTNVFTMQV